MIYRFRPPIDDIINFGAYTRDAWVAEKAATLTPGLRVLDVGAGQCPYRSLFSHCDYKAQDFAQYKGTTSGSQVESWNYGKINFVSDITSIPVSNASFDVILCTEVLEHVPKPIDTLQELSRILVPGGRMFLTAPLGCGLHQQPYHFYGGYTPHFYKKFLADFNFEIIEIKPIGGLMKHVGQETHRVGRILTEKAPKRLSLLEKYILMNWLPRYLSKLDDKIFVEEFTVGYLVEARKIG